MNTYKINTTTNGILITNVNNASFTVKCLPQLADSIRHLLEFFLNNDRYTATIHKGDGFIKCFSDEREYLMAIKICRITDKQEAREFNNFFIQVPF